MATPVFLHGKDSTIQIGGTYFAALTINYDDKLSDLTDITYTKSGGVTFGIFLPGYRFATGTVTFVYDSANQPVLDPQKMIPGTLMTIILTPGASKMFSFQAYSGEFQWAGGPRTGPTACSTNWTSNDTITVPTS